VGDFINQAMLTDVAAIGAFYADWTTYGAGVLNYLSVPDMPMDTKGTQFALPGGYIPAGDIGQFAPLASQREKTLHEGIKESIKHAWYNGAWDRSPYDEETVPDYTGYDYDKKYSWVKAPTYLGKPAQVGPLPHVVAMYLAGHEPTKTYVDNTLKTVSAIAGATVGIDALHSTIGRIAARVIRCAVLHDNLGAQWQALIDNIGKGDYTTFNTPVFPKGEQRGAGFHEAPRGMLSHWIVIDNGKIKNYQCVVPSTWNAGPRNDADELGPYEASLVGNPVADPELPLEVLRIACAIHLVDGKKTPLGKVKVL
jgi:hydrogenase large subunit